ncbi:MAG TPA: hypothetical protein VM367_10800 [Pseudonocardia sp.]|jgi:hypothetical protein|nr:hypothetical protein [Pseudonocardia sp.]
MTLFPRVLGAATAGCAVVAPVRPQIFARQVGMLAGGRSALCALSPSATRKRA